MGVLEGVARRPLVSATLIYLFGVLCGQFPGAVVPFAAAGIAVALFSAGLHVRHVVPAGRRRLFPLVRRAAGLLCVLGAAWCWSAQDASRRVSRLAAMRHWVDARVVVEGTVCGDPDVLSTGKGAQLVVVFPFRVDTVTADEVPHVLPAGSVMTVRWLGGSKGRPVYGDRWRFRGRLEERRRGRPAQLRLPTGAGSSTHLSSGHGLRLLAACYATRRWAAEELTRSSGGDQVVASVLQALLLGYRSEVDRETLDRFARTGAIHVFAISGLHVGIVAGFIVLVLRLLRVPRQRWVLGLAPLLLCYTLATGMRASAVRASIMAVTYAAAPFLGRRADSYSSLSFAALLILVVTPAQVSDTGFVFSFVVVLGLVSLYRLFHRPMREFWQPDVLRLLPEAGPVRAGRRVALWFTSLFAVSCAAWVASAPLTAYVFGRFSPAALLGNMVVVPLTFAIVFCGFLSLLCGACWAWLGGVIGLVSVTLVKWLLGIVNGVSHLPLGCIDVENVPLWGVFLWYALLTAAAVWLYRCQQNANAPAYETADPSPDNDWRE